MQDKESPGGVWCLHHHLNLTLLGLLHVQISYNSQNAL